MNPFGRMLVFFPAIFAFGRIFSSLVPSCRGEEVSVLPVNNAALVEFKAPAFVLKDETFFASVTLSNNGTSAWTTGVGRWHKLGPQNPSDTRFWRAFHRIDLPHQPVLPGET